MSDFKESTEYQQKTWDSVADLWHKYRQRPMKEAKEFLKPFLKGKDARILDLCCGSGRHFTRIEGEYYGVDFSEQMIKHAHNDVKKRNLKISLKVALAYKLPFENNYFDAIIFTSGLHCIETKHRIKVLEEIKRVLKPDGKVFITVWNRYQPRFLSKDKIAYVPWKKDGKKHLRYYYLFTKSELKKLVEDNGLIVDTVAGSENKAFKRFSRNIVLVAHKAKT